MAEEKALDMKSRVREMIPQEALGEIPQIRILGNNYLELENHKGILGFSSREIRIALRRGVLAVSGEELEIARMNQDLICLEGRISRVDFTMK